MCFVHAHALAANVCGKFTEVAVGVMEEMECDELQIDLGYGSRAAAGGPMVEGQAGMTWLEAAEHVLWEHGGPGMHIRHLTRTIMELGIARG